MSRITEISVEIDQAVAEEAATILGTATLGETIDTALQEVVSVRKRLELVAMFSEEGRFDFRRTD